MGANRRVTPDSRHLYCLSSIFQSAITIYHWLTVMPLASSFVSPPLGFSIPYLTPHAVSVSLPTWRDNVGYEEGEKRVVEAMQTGYPRFFVHRSIQKVHTILLAVDLVRLIYLAADDPIDFGLMQLAGIANSVLANNKHTDKCYLYPTGKIARAAVSFLESRRDPALSAPAYYKPWRISEDGSQSSKDEDSTTIYAVFMNEADFSLGKQYWQHTGDGISSRLAEHCLQLLGESPVAPTPSASSAISLQQTSTGQRDNPSVSSAPARGGFSRNKHYSKKSSAALEAIIASSTPATPSSAEEQPENHASTSATATNGTAPSQAYKEDLSTYIEERYARNLAQSQAPLAKTAMKRRIAGVLKETPSSSTSPAVAHTDDIIEEFTSPPSSETLQKSTRGVTGLTEEDVYLYPTGMSAIFHAFMTVLRAAELSGVEVVGKSVCFGFPYTDTLKILQKWGPGCHFFGRGLDSDLDDLENLLRKSRERHEKNPDSMDPEDKPILSLFCEFPSNPLLRSPNLQRLRQLADKYGFTICVDETVGGFVNVECLPHADIVMSSLTKVFSGDSNVMGGS